MVEQTSGCLPSRDHRWPLFRSGPDQVFHAVGHQAKAVVAEVGDVVDHMHVHALAIGGAEGIVVV